MGRAIFRGSDEMKNIKKNLYGLTAKFYIPRFTQLKGIFYSLKDMFFCSLYRIYDIQSAGHAYTTVPDLIGAMDPSFISYMKNSIKFVMKTSGFGDTFIDEMVMGALRTNYGQNTDIPGFVGQYFRIFFIMGKRYEC